MSCLKKPCKARPVLLLRLSFTFGPFLFLFNTTLRATRDGGRHGVFRISMISSFCSVDGTTFVPTPRSNSGELVSPSSGARAPQQAARPRICAKIWGAPSPAREKRHAFASPPREQDVAPGSTYLRR